MTDRFEPPKAPLRAERRPLSATQNIQSVPATPSGLIRSTLVAASAAGAILIFFWLPAEYGIDPTGVGALTGLTEMGEIKQQLAAEAEADAKEVTASEAASVTPTPSGVPEVVLHRLDKIDAQLAAIVTMLGAPVGAAEAVAASELAPEPAPVVALSAANPDPVEAAGAEATEAFSTAPGWRDEVTYTLDPGQGIEVKLVMEKGQVARFAWTANGSVVNFDLHGDGSGQKISYEQGRAVPDQTGELTAAFTGNHGWFWRNRTEAPVTVTLRTGGEYADMKTP